MHGAMNNEKTKEEFEWKIIQLAFEFQEVQLSDALSTIEAAWRMWQDPETMRAVRRENLRVIEGGKSVQI